MTIEQIGILAAIYPATWGVAQLGTGGLSDRLGRKWLIVSGMWVQAAGLVWVGATSTFAGFAVGGVFMGVGTAMVYPTLLAAIADVAAPSWRGSALGVFRFWRDSGYVAGAVIAGLVADLFGFTSAIWLVAFLTCLSGVVVSMRLTETLGQISVTAART